MKKLLLILGILSVSFADYTQSLYTKDLSLNSARSVDLIIANIQAYTSGAPLDIGLQKDGNKSKIEKFFVVQKTIRKDLLSTLLPVQLEQNGKKVRAYSTKYKASAMGDHLFVAVGAPFYSYIEGVYIQQFTKTVLNIAGKPSDWDLELGLDAEIVPLSKPYAISKGGSFSAMVKASGIPVPYAHIQAELLGFEFDLKNKKMSSSKLDQNAHQSMKTLEFKADKNAQFTLHLAQKGQWSICAKGIGHKKDYKEHELSQDGCIWVEVK